MQSLREFIPKLDDDRSRPEFIVCNRTEVDPVMNLFRKVFNEQLSISEATLPDEAEDIVLLLRNGEVVASSSLGSVMDSLLLVNSDIFRTGTAGVSKNRLPPVISETTDTKLTLRGYPVSNKEKLLWIAISREIEARALESDSGRLDAGFQNLIRIDDEFGTQQVYEDLSASNVETHVYGAGGRDWIRNVSTGLDLRVHLGDTEEYRRAWFVVFTPDGNDQGAAFVSWQIGDNTWEGAWTYRPELVEQIHRYVIEEFR